MKTKKIPLRKCVVCGERKEKKGLIRVVNNKEEGILIDPTGKKNGRGAYICRENTCIESAQKSKKLNQSLKSNIPEDIYKELLDYVEAE